MSKVSMRDMLEAGVHFGHQTKFWNPKMKPFIFGEKSKVHIIDLQQSLPLFLETTKFAQELASRGGSILFVGSKRSAKKVIREAAESCDMPYVCNRWLGGMLTNFDTIKKSVKRLKALESIFESEEAQEDYTKRELLTLSRELEKLEKTLGGIKNMNRLPDALFVIDVRYEKIAIKEAKNLKIPVIGVVDTNSSPDDIDMIIPGNDDAISSIRLYTKGIAEAISEGRTMIPDMGDEFIELDEVAEPNDDNAVEPKIKKKATKKKVRAKKEEKLASEPEETSIPEPGSVVQDEKPETQALNEDEVVSEAEANDNESEAVSEDKQ